jgi:hypothetical protein
MNHKLPVLILFLAALGVSFEARSAEITSKDLEGTWVIDQANCADAEAEFVKFRKDGAVESVRAGKLEAAGFWKLGEEMVDIHVIASPAFFHDLHPDLKVMEGQFYAFKVRLFPFNVESGSFESIGVIGDQIRRASFSRCKS